MPNQILAANAPDASGREQTRTEIAVDASGDAQSAPAVTAPENPSLNSDTAHARPDASRRARAANQPPPENWIIIDQAIGRFAAAGLPIKLRTLQKYCLNNKLRATFAMTEKNTVKYFIDPTSIEKFIAGEQQKAPLHSDERKEETNVRAPDASGRAHVRDGLEVFEHPYVKRLEREVDDYKHKYDTLQAVARADLIKLHETYAVAQSETLAKYLLLDKGKSTGQPVDNAGPQNESAGV